MLTPAYTRHRHVLPNGLPLVLVELPHLHSASLIMYVRVGSRFESVADNGLSHFLEHMLFRGTARHPDAYQMNYAIEDLGGTLYAETARDYSLYQLSLHPETVVAGIELLGEIFHTPVFHGIEIERRILLEEILEDLDEEGRLINVGDLARQAMFPDHPLGFSIAGSYDNVARFTLADVERHFRRSCGARNMLLCIAGAFDRSQVLSAVERTLAGLQPGEALSSPPPAPPRGAPHLMYVANPGSQTALHLLFRAVPETHPDFPALIALSRVLDDGMSTRLHHRICDELGLAYYVSSSIDPLHDTSLVELDASCAHASVPDLLAELLALVARLRDEPPTAAELSKAKRRYRLDADAALDDPDAMAGWLAAPELYGQAPGFAEKLARMEAVTRDDVCRVARQIFVPGGLSVAAVGDLDKQGEQRLREGVARFV